MKRFALLLSLFAATTPALAQGANPCRGHDLRRAMRDRTVIVGFQCNDRIDFDKLETAAAWVATKQRGFVGNQVYSWKILVRPGKYYLDGPLVVPSYTIVQGDQASAANPDIPSPTVYIAASATLTAGSMITVNSGGGMSHVSVWLATPNPAVPTAAMAGIEAVGITSFDHVAVIILAGSGASAPLTGVRVTGATSRLTWSHGIVVSSAFASNTHTTHMTVEGGSSAWLNHSSFWTNGAAVPAALVHSSTGTVRVDHSRFDAGNGSTFTVDLTNASSGALEVYGSSFRTSSGAITYRDGSPVFATSLPATCAVPSVLYTATQMCGCTAANTWLCAALAAP